jgi:tRNA pseudouridine38-40 synthase
VHVRAQVVHADFDKPLLPHNLIMGTNFYLQHEAVVVVDAVEVPADFNARFSALGREYEYHILNRTAYLALDHGRAWHVPEALDADAMHTAAQLLLGTHDFTSFRATECQAQSPIRTLDRLDVVRDGDHITIHTAARSFLHHQVRNMVGSLRAVGNGKWNCDDLLAALAARDRRAGGETAPACGLYFTAVHYPPLEKLST